MSDDDTAATIYQTHLDLVSKAVWEGNIEALLAHTDMPFTTVTSDGTRTAKSSDDATRQLVGFRTAMLQNGATAYHRVSLGAEFDADNPDLIHGRHTTYILRGGNYASDPYICELTLRHSDGRWLQSFTTIQRAVVGPSFFLKF